MTTIATVAPTELIRSSWGNSVAVELNSNTVKIAGSTMTGDLILSSTSSNAAAVMPKSYIDGKVSLTGGGFLAGSYWITAADAYCLRLKSAVETPTIDFFNNAAAVQFGYIKYTATAATFAHGVGSIVLQPPAGGYVDLFHGGGLRGRFQSSVFLWGKGTSDAVTSGFEMLGVGSGAVGSFRSIMNEPGNPNLYIRRESGSVSTGTDFASFLTNVAGVGLGIAGAIRITGSGSGVAYLTSSDYRIKNVIGPVVDALDQCRALQPRLLEMKQDPGHEFIGFLAHEVQAVMPSAVSGDKDDVYTVEEADDLAGIEAGDPKMQQLDVSKLTPLLTAAIQELAARVDVLEAQ
jgi:hypothetical protein